MARCACAALLEVLAAGCVALPGMAAEPRAASAIEGDWVRVDSHGSGTFGALADSFRAASLTPRGAAALAQLKYGQRELPATGPHKVGEPYVVVDRPCSGGPFTEGVLGIDPDSGAIHVVVARAQVLIAPERGGARVIYLDGRSHPDASRWTPRGTGHGVGHFEGAVLVVDTVGLTAGSVPAGGWRTAQTHLGERFKVSPDGRHLSIQYTYTDPAVYRRPHTYEYQFERLPAPSYALEEWCDPGDPKERQSIVPPPQN